MKFLILGDIVGESGREVINDNLKKICDKNKIDFIVVNGENSANDAFGITDEIANNLFSLGVDVITSGNHIWDKKETIKYIQSEKRLLRPSNFISGSPGSGTGIFKIKNSNYKVGVINLMGNVFMRKTEDVFKTAKDIIKKIILKKNGDFLIIDFHGEITSEKMAIAHYYDGKATCIVGTHTHVPTADTRILDKGTAYQTDLGMCGDYNSVIGMNKENSLMRFFKDKKATKHFPSNGLGTISGLIINADNETGLAKKAERIIFGGVFK